jgi:hypothetical protein
VETETDRTPTSRRGVLAAGAGLAIAALATGSEEAAAASVAQPGWRFCPKCRGLFFSPRNEPAGVCPDGGKHKPLKSVSYVLYAGSSGGVNLWTKWFKCTKCAGLFHSSDGGREAGVCPKGGAHDHRGGTQFVLWYGPGIPPATDDAWDGCHKCLVQFNYAGVNDSVCPVDGNQHQVVGGDPVKLVRLF